MWLLNTETRIALQKAYTANMGIDSSLYTQKKSLSSLLPLNVNNGVAFVPVVGTLTKQPNIFAELFGGGNTTYADINAALFAADKDPTVDTIILNIDSPGGQFEGLFDTLNAINSISKPIVARVDGMAASAAFAIASQADQIVASNIASLIGSVGVVTSFFVDEQEVTITSTDAPKKAPDVTTDEGVAAVRERLDAIHNIFVESIAKGRDTSVRNVNENFGQGATLLAEEALSNGMIDAIAVTGVDVKNEGSIMDLNELKTAHSDVYSQAIQLGVSQERDRAMAHLTLGMQSGDMLTAQDAIENGLELTNTISAKYQLAHMNKNSIKLRESDALASEVVDGAVAVDKNLGATVMDLMEQQVGLRD